MKKIREYTEPNADWAAYEAAVEAWEEEDERINAETGARAACERADEASHEVYCLRDKIVAIRATTLAGLKFKAEFAFQHCVGEPDEEVMQSIMEDLLAMDASVI